MSQNQRTLLTNNGFELFFKTALGSDTAPYPYQTNIANAPTWPDIIKIETGLGKTAAIILAWLFKRINKNPHTPRRLVFCLPMRVLVEQTVKNTNKWLTNLLGAGLISPDSKPVVSVLMGGEVDRDWDRYPEQESILIGT